MNFVENLSYLDILKKNKELESDTVLDPYRIVVLSNIIVKQVKEILEYSLRSESIRGNVEFGDYDTIVQDSLRYRDSKTVVVFWEASNIVDGLHYKSEVLDANRRKEIVEKTKSEIDLVLRNLSSVSLLLFNRFSTILFSSSNLERNHFDEIVDELNSYLEQKKQTNLKIVDVDRIISAVGVRRSVDWRYYYSSKALYSIDFFKSYVDIVKPFFLAANGKTKKALIFDCDNTLWGGILGEDGITSIEMSSKTKTGAIFHEVQNIAMTLSSRGILIGLCSKNNPADVDEVLRSHPDMVLKDEFLAIKKVNWQDKAANLQEIRKELNIGMDSIVYVDDSPFEVDLLRQQLSALTVLQVPEKVHEYPNMLRRNLGMFQSNAVTDEDHKRLGLYKVQADRERGKNEFENVEEYLKSLGLRVNVHEDDPALIPRMSQMTQKTNQFNLTTQRYSESDIKTFIDSKEARTFAFSVSDKYGDNGVTGLCVLKINRNAQIAEIDSFLMSCRIIGRNIEYAVMDYLVEWIKNNHLATISSKYKKTSKNEQVREFYERCSFRLISSNDTVREYELDVGQYNPRRLDYIEITNT